MTRRKKRGLRSQCRDLVDRFVDWVVAGLAHTHGVPTEWGSFIARVVLISLVIGLTNCGLLILFAIKRAEQINGVGSQVALARAEVEVVKRENVDFQKRTMQRWDSLSFMNPEIEVPAAKEPQPIGTDKLSPQQLRRNPRSPTPVPTALPTPSPRVVFKTKRVYVPKSTPYRWPWQKPEKTR